MYQRGVFYVSKGVLESLPLTRSDPEMETSKFRTSKSMSISTDVNTINNGPISKPFEVIEHESAVYQTMKIWNFLVVYAMVKNVDEVDVFQGAYVLIACVLELKGCPGITTLFIWSCCVTFPKG